MHVLRHPRAGDPRLGRAVLTLGNFDGVHRGHQAILERTIALARAHDARAGLVTFQPHPAVVVSPGRAPELIVPLRGKLALLAATKLDFVWLARFTPEFAQLTPEAFVGTYLSARVHIVAMVVGDNVSFGRKRTGNAEVLRQLGDRFGFRVEIVGPVTEGGVRVSSTAVRAAIRDGDVVTAAALLGRNHALWGRVGQGDRRGRTLGFPTANLVLRGGLLPRDGVYVVRARVHEATYGGVANVGSRPTFGGQRRGIEVHLLDFDGDLYGRRLCVELVARLRDEMRFPSADALVRQIGEDATQARRVLTARPRESRS
jgi:riboflavin kinase/FMN adenylyltransferase